MFKFEHAQNINESLDNWKIWDIKDVVTLMLFAILCFNKRPLLPNKKNSILDQTQSWGYQVTNQLKQKAYKDTECDKPFYLFFILRHKQTFSLYNIAGLLNKLNVMLCNCLSKANFVLRVYQMEVISKIH